MLINEPRVMQDDPILAMIAAINGRSADARALRVGVYEVGHHGSSDFLRDYEHHPVLGEVREFSGHKFGNFGPYGVCDSVEQLLAACPELEAPGREFVVTVTPVRKSEQPSEGGWRWHKWGEYIGTQDPQCEYIHDEPRIEQVLCFHIYERVA